MKPNRKQEISEESQEATEEIQEINDETPKPSEKPLPPKIKRMMSDAQKENLTKARAKAFELRKQLKEKTGPIKKQTKLEKRLEDIQHQPYSVVEDSVEDKVIVEEEVVVKKMVAQVKPLATTYNLVKNENGFFYIHTI